MQPVSSITASPLMFTAAVPSSAALPENTTDLLVRSRLGVYSGLFFALRAKHPPTAAHGLRVALGCSKWSGWRDMDDDHRSLIEVAALLHDVGKIGIPDRVLQKPGQLDGQEQSMMEMSGRLCAEMLRGAGADKQLIDIIQAARVGFVNGQHLEEAAGQLHQPEESEIRLPLPSRMLAIVDAFDSMTTEQVFRRALSRERAVHELFQHAGSQFDPQLVEDFAEMISQPRPELETSMSGRWLAKFLPESTAGFSEFDVPVSCGAMQELIDTIFHRRLLDTLADAAIYLDSGGQVLQWNRAAERLTGRQASSLVNRIWTADLMGLRCESGTKLIQSDCPLRAVLDNHVPSNVRLSVEHCDGRQIKVNFTAVPIFSGSKELSGIIMIIRDASAQASLEERVQSLNKIASQDNLTKVANRAELDRRMPEYLRDHQEMGLPVSTIICDIDHFKRINDTFGHQAGDDALVTFAGVLRELSREGDLVARYGGEEFVILCACCDNPAATARAEEIRRAVEHTPVPALDGATMTASFGVTESQAGDTHSTFLARADRALLTAKSTGRNRVVQLGAGQNPDPDSQPHETLCPKRTATWLDWFRTGQQAPIIQTERLASVPHAIAVQKLEGFISDHKAEVLKTDTTGVTLRISYQRADGTRRKGERTATMLMEVLVKPVDYRNPRTNTYQTKTKLEITIRLVKARDRRTEALQSQAKQLLASFNSYLVAQEITDEVRASLAEHR